MRYKKGDIIGSDFLVLDEAEGGLGEVYFCFKLDLNDCGPRVLKTLKHQEFATSDFEKHFKSEALTWISLENHPNIVKCHITVHEEYMSYMLLEWIYHPNYKDVSLRKRIQSYPFYIEDAIKIVLGICEGLIHANEKIPGIVHRDIKPENILIDHDEKAKITDFGLTTILAKSKLDKKSEFDFIREVNPGSGTPLYMAPELWLNQTFDTRTDIYSVGCILYELIENSFAFGGESINKIRSNHLEGKIPQVKQKELSELNGVIAKCLAKKPDDRYESFIDLSKDLKKIDLVELGTSRMQMAIHHGNMALTFLNEEQYSLAEKHFNKAIELDPKLSRAYNNRGLMYSKLNEYEKSIQNFSKAIELNPRLVAALNNRANSYNQIGEYEKSLEDLNKAISIDPDFTSAILTKTQTLNEMGRYEEALQESAKIEGKASIRNKFLMTRSKILRNLGEFDQSLKDLNEIETQDSLESLAKIFELIKTYIKMGNVSEADKIVSDFVKSYSENERDTKAYALGLFAKLFEECGANINALEYYLMLVDAGFDKYEIEVENIKRKIILGRYGINIS